MSSSSSQTAQRLLSILRAHTTLRTELIPAHPVTNPTSAHQEPPRDLCRPETVLIELTPHHQTHRHRQAAVKVEGRSRTVTTSRSENREDDRETHRERDALSSPALRSSHQSIRLTRCWHHRRKPLPARPSLFGCVAWQAPCHTLPHPRTYRSISYPGVTRREPASSPEKVDLHIASFSGPLFDLASPSPRFEIIASTRVLLLLARPLLKPFLRMIKSAF